MPFQLVTLPKAWFVTDVFPGKFEVLSQVLNKGYSKPMAKYGIIESPRIKSHEHFLESLQLDSGEDEKVACKDKNFAIMLLLGSKGDFANLQKEHGYVRKFNPEIWPLPGANDSDIPAEFADAFGDLVPGNVHHVTLSPSDRLDTDILDRVVATMGVKSYAADGYFSESDVSPKTAHFELTAFTSFMPRVGTKLMDYIVENFLLTEGENFLKSAEISKIVLHAIVIKEHELVPFYTSKCGFSQSRHPDLLISPGEVGSALEDGIKATQDFRIAFLRKELASMGYA